MRRLGKSQRMTDCHDKGGVDLTPMLDVVFILLIFFIVVASFVRETAMPEYSSPSSASVSSEQAAVIITLSAGGRVHVDERLVALNAIRALMAQKRARFGDQLQVAILFREDATVALYTSVIDALHQAAIRNISLKAV